MRRGFISTYYLVIFLIAAGLVSVILSNVDNRLKTAANMIRVNKYLACEETVVNGLKCALRNDGPESGTYSVNGVTYTVEAGEKQAHVTISMPVYEVLTVYYDRETCHIYDYDVTREETPL